MICYGRGCFADTNRHAGQFAFPNDPLRAPHRPALGRLPLNGKGVDGQWGAVVVRPESPPHEVTLAQALHTRSNAPQSDSIAPAAGEMLLVVAAVAAPTAATQPSLSISDSGIISGSWTAFGSALTYNNRSKITSHAWYATADGDSGTVTVTNSNSNSDPVASLTVLRIANHNGIDNHHTRSAQVNFGVSWNTLRGVFGFTPLTDSLVVSTLIQTVYTGTTLASGRGWTELAEPAHVTAVVGSGHTGGAGFCLHTYIHSAIGATFSDFDGAGDDYWSFQWNIAIKRAAPR